MTSAGRKDPLIKGHLPGRSTQNGQCARRLAPGLAHGAAVREPTPGFPAPGRMADIAGPAAWSGCQGLGNRAQDLLLIGAQQGGLLDEGPGVAAEELLAFGVGQARCGGGDPGSAAAA
jgi:hypothetical protein